MSSQASRQAVLPNTHGLEPWVNFLRAHAATTRRLNAQLVTHHGLTINDYEVLLHLARAPDHGLKRVELVQRLLLTPSGITRLLGGLETAGYVERAACDMDARVVYAKITEAGLAKLRDARETHLTGIHTLFLDRFSPEEQQTLSLLLERLPLAGDAVACTTE